MDFSFRTGGRGGVGGRRCACTCCSSTRSSSTSTASTTPSATNATTSHRTIIIFGAHDAYHWNAREILKGMRHDRRPPWKHSRHEDPKFVRLHSF